MTCIPRIFSLGHLPLHDRVQILQPRRTDERLVAHIDVAGYRVVAEVDRIGERYLLNPALRHHLTTL